MSITIRGMSKHIDQIFNVWEGIKLTLQKVAYTKDDNGNIIDTQYQNHTIEGIISNHSVEYNDQASGYVNNRTATGIFKYGEPMPDIEDKITENVLGKTYEVISIDSIDYDYDAPAALTCTLQEVPQ